ncbi:TetR family transcriptional regulator [Nonomuraea sediminis]|uniref:TetR family transcriptional regulator n=1 Tax=Nonomuraea sediminis TaxID=2835864 RepID=UPI001BDBD522|nr:TetR family transcriptional regulator [Nonomuraea sediminis]
MTEGTLTADHILAAAEDVLRRYGPAKATVVDVARALGVSHGSVYRHFPSKAALREAVTQRWLDQSQTALDAVMNAGGPAEARLQDWLTVLFGSKRKKALDDPELFATYMVLVAEASQVIERHVADLVGQIRAILVDGVARGEFVVQDLELTTRAVFDATNRFHDPAYASEWSQPGIEDNFDALWHLLLHGLRSN